MDVKIGDIVRGSTQYSCTNAHSICEVIKICDDGYIEAKILKYDEGYNQPDEIGNSYCISIYTIINDDKYKREKRREERKKELVITF